MTAHLTLCSLYAQLALRFTVEDLSLSHFGSVAFFDLVAMAIPKSPQLVAAVVLALVSIAVAEVYFEEKFEGTNPIFRDL